MRWLDGYNREIRDEPVAVAGRRENGRRLGGRRGLAAMNEFGAERQRGDRRRRWRRGWIVLGRRRRRLAGQGEAEGAAERAQVMAQGGHGGEQSGHAGLLQQLGEFGGGGAGGLRARRRQQADQPAPA